MRLIHTIAVAPSKAVKGEQPVLVYDSPEFKFKKTLNIIWVRTEWCIATRSQLRRWNREKWASCKILLADSLLHWITLLPEILRPKDASIPPSWLSADACAKTGRCSWVLRANQAGDSYYSLWLLVRIMDMLLQAKSVHRPGHDLCKPCNQGNVCFW